MPPSPHIPQPAPKTPPSRRRSPRTAAASPCRPSRSKSAARDHLYSKRYGVAPSLALGLGTPARITLQYYHLDTEGIPDYGHPVQAATGEPIAVDRSVFYGQVKRDYQDTQTDMGTVKIKHDLNEYMKLTNSTRFGITISDYVRSCTATRPPLPSRNARCCQNWSHGSIVSIRANYLTGGS